MVGLFGSFGPVPRLVAGKFELFLPPMVGFICFPGTKSQFELQTYAELSSNNGEFSL